MDNRSFDSWTRSLATRLSRRSALKTGGALVAAGALVVPARQAVPARLAAAAQSDTGAFWYTVIRRYRFDGQVEPVRQALMDSFRPLLCAADGFRAYLAVEVTETSSRDATPDATPDPDEQVLVTVTAFGSRSQFEAFASSEADWVNQYLGTALPEPEETIVGDAYVRAGLPQSFGGTCPAPPSTPTATATAAATATATATSTPTATATATSSPTATATATSGAETATPSPQPTATQAPESTATPTSTPTPCTIEGCSCMGGVLGNCDPGLTCCLDEPGLPGGAGTCRTACPSPTPTAPPCTSLTCQCDPDVPNFCDEGLICCRSQLLCFPPENC